MSHPTSITSIVNRISRMVRAGGVVLLTGLLLVMAPTSGAQSIFSADFNDFTAPDGNFNGGQFESELAVGHSGNLPDWDKAGGGTVHAVDVANVFPDIDNARDFAVMIWQDNVITLRDAIPGSNEEGKNYSVNFSVSPAVYQAPSQVTTESDGILIEVLRSDDTVLAEMTQEPGAWAGEIALMPGSFQYTGDGTGDVHLRIGPSAPGSGHFGGAIDNVSLAAVAPTIFSEDFNGLDPATGRAIGFQHTTTFSIANWADVSGLAGWSDNGVAGEVHVVDTANWDGNTGNARNSAVMIWHGGPNTVTMDNVIAGSNDLGVEYQVDFRIGGAVFFNGAQFNDPTLNDSVVIEILRGDDSVLSSHSEVSPEVVEALDLGFESRSFSYTGDGSGDIRFRVTGSGDEGSIRFYGAIDDLVLSIPIAAPTIFTADFNDFDAPEGNFNGGQFESELAVAHSGELSEWEKSGGGTVHVVDTANVFPDIDNPRDFAVMIWQDNVITLFEPIPGSNATNTNYTVQFSASPAVYQAPPQVTTDADGLLIEVLRADDTVLAEFTHEPGPWDGDILLVPGSFQYTGDGSGDIRLRIGPSNRGSGHFGGAIDNVGISTSNSEGPKITSFTVDPDELTVAGSPVKFEWAVDMPLDALVITPGDIDVLANTDAEGNGSVTLDPGPAETTRYKLTAARGEASIFTFTSVAILPPEIAKFEATPSEASPGTPLTLAWEVILPLTSLTLSPGDVDLLAMTDENGMGALSFDPGPLESTTYTLTAQRGDMAVTARAGRFIADPNSIYVERFNDCTAPDGNFNGGQFESNLPVVFAAESPGWESEGVNAIHAVDTANVFPDIDVPRDFVVMIWQDNVITQVEPIPGSNAAGVAYDVRFDASPAVYQAGSQQTSEEDGLLIEILRNDDSVLTDFIHEPGAWEGDIALVPGGFTYTGDGSGDVRIRIGPSNPNSGRFGGAIDNITIGPVISGPFDIVHIDRAQETSEVTIEFTSVSGVTYAVLASTDLITWEIIDNAVMGTDDITAFTDAVFALASDGQAFYSVALLPPPRHFADDFETGAEGWTVTPTEGDTLWEMGMPNVDDLTNANSGLNAWGTNISGDYTPNSVASLRSPVIDLAELPRPRLTFNYFIDTVEGIEGGQLRFLDENGEEIIPPSDDIFSGTTDGWTPFSMLLPQEVRGRKIIIEFRFLADDDNNVGAGWYIDDVVVDK